MQSTGQGGTHNSHPVHKSSITLCIKFEAPWIASTGHASMHFLQPIHSSSIMNAFGWQCQVQNPYPERYHLDDL